MLTPTQFIYRAAMRTPRVTTAAGKEVIYEPPELVEVEDETCWLCGGATGGRGQPTKKAIKPTFTDHPYARGNGSTSICPSCVFCLSRRELRNYSILATTTKLLHPSRPQIRDILLAPPEPPFLLAIAVSGQKWIHFKAVVNHSAEVFTVNLEEQLVEVEPSRLGELLESVEQLYAYFSKDEISTGRYTQGRIRAMGLDRWSQIEDQVSPYRGSRLFELAVFVAQKRDKPERGEEKEENLIAPVPKTQPDGEGQDNEPAQLRFDGL